MEMQKVSEIRELTADELDAVDGGGTAAAVAGAVERGAAAIADAVVASAYSIWSLIS